MKKTALFIAIAFMANLNMAYPKLKMPYFFTDNMVIQQQMQSPIWGKADKGSIVKIRTGWNNVIYTAKADNNGDWKIKIQTPAAGGPFIIVISEGKESIAIKNVYSGEVWLMAGQSNMEIPLKGYRDQPIEGSNLEVLNSAGRNIHWFKVDRASTTFLLDTVKPTAWKVAAPDNAADISATGWYFAKMLQEHLNVPIGLLECNYAGSSAEAWMRPEALAKCGDFKIPAKGDTIKVQSRTPTTLYNAMLHPIIGYGIRGCIWYQGESNYTRPFSYEKVFTTLIDDWRNIWGQGDYPFYYAEIAPFDYARLNEKDYVNSAYIRDAQRKSESKIKNSGMIVLLDAGDEKTIHPMNKVLPGERFALMALAKTYGMKGIGYASPKFKSMEVKDGKATLFFDDAPNGLSSFGKDLDLFEIAGSDRIFHPAEAKINNGKVIVSCKDVTEPVAVRYAFKDYVKGNLFGTDGLPVSSFRTDDW